MMHLILSILISSFLYVEINSVPQDKVGFFSGSLFGFTAIFGIGILLIKRIIGKEKFELKSILGGIALRIPNYYFIVFLIKALQNKGFESSTLFTVNNVGIVVVSTLIGLLLFKESFSLKNKIGVALAVLGIVLVTIT